MLVLAIIIGLIGVGVGLQYWWYQILPKQVAEDEEGGDE